MGPNCTLSYASDSACSQDLSTGGGGLKARERSDRVGRVWERGVPLPQYIGGFFFFVYQNGIF